MPYTVFDKVYESTKVNYDVMAIVNDLSDYVIDNYAMESSGMGVGNLIRSIIKKAIEILNTIINGLKKFVTSVKLLVTKQLRQIKDTRNVKRNAIYTQIYNIDIQIKQLRKEYDETKDDEVVVKIDELLNKREQLLQEYKWLGDYYVISAEHYALFEEGRTICDNGLTRTMEIFTEFNTELEAYKYIPLLQDINASQIDKEKVAVHTTGEDPLSRFITNKAADATVATKAGGSQYYKEWTEDDDEYNDYIAIVDRYSTGSWKSEVKAWLQQVNEIHSRIATIKADNTLREQVQAIKISTVNEYLKKNDRDLSKAAEIESAIRSYKTILEREYKRPDKKIDIRKRGMFFNIKTKKAPEYLMRIIATLQTLVDSYKAFIANKSKLIFSVQTGRM